ncbi:MULTISPECIES: glucose 1-dehydrogenase [unclassified Pseudomonas]|uniref:SDR family NAD(P)-dependent oxidoreductase n=1 Tax=unclassified Pseudomonas TaxID=196821 RepID=UPI000D3D1015|nr:MULTISPECIES: glucose 1-dehydrogenase [unclassified Pseudomonas]RAU43817.1 SDR family NAD(P)-dependent oxidoreductase [Pseudomonas sp. RIT 409]RAU56289.1 SDR family NAD(P)-dependent oxidoreductase [Pseudomonas sp. RIT 412]
MLSRGGGAQGLGESHSRLFAELGAHLVITDVETGAGFRLAQELTGMGYVANFQELDVSDEANWGRVIKQVLGQHRRIDVLVNNAGIYLRTQLEEISAQQFDKVMAINVKGTFLGCKAVAPVMRAQGGGVIVNTGSIAAMVANLDGEVAYCASKGAIKMLTKAVASDLAKDNIRVNSVHPGVVKTPMAADFFKDPQLAKQLLGTTLMERAAAPAEISQAIAFLISDSASFMTGSDLVVDGGFTAV